MVEHLAPPIPNAGIAVYGAHSEALNSAENNAQQEAPGNVQTTDELQSWSDAHSHVRSGYGADSRISHYTSAQESVATGYTSANSQFDDAVPYMGASHNDATWTSPQSTWMPRPASGAIPVDILDPVGGKEMAQRIAAEDSLSNDEMTQQGDLEKKQGSADPFDEHATFNLGLFLRDTIEEQQQRGYLPPTMGVAFQDLKVTGYGVGAKFNTTLGSLFTAPFRLISDFRGMTARHVKHILYGVTGCVKPGEMLLVLGRPGAGSTTFLKSLCSYREGYRSIEGDVLYEGFSYKMINGPLRGEVVYAPEDDIHFPVLSVADTLGFAAAARAPNDKYRPTLDRYPKRKDYAGFVREAIATVLGLRHTYNTKVGNATIRGVSGGERKRVSIGEVLASRARIVMFDNSSRGLDSSTALEFGQALRVSTDVARTTTLSSIYQAGESLTKLFDKVVVLNQGRCVYFGPRAQAADYFKSIGYLPHDRQTTADFLVSCTDPVGRRLNPAFNTVPVTPDEQAMAFSHSDLGRANQAEVEAYMSEMRGGATPESKKEFITRMRELRSKHERRNSPYLLTWGQQVRLAIRRRFKITLGEYPIFIIMFSANLFQALIMGSVFFQMPKMSSGLFSRSGVIFFALLYNSFSAMAEVPNNYEQRPIVIRHQRFAFLHPSADAIGLSLLDIPSRFIPLTGFIIVLYFMTGLEYDAGKFFIFFFLTALITFTMVTFFRMITALTRSVAVATMVAGLVIIDCALYAGYAIPRPSMVVWWRWLSYCNPVAFGFEVLLANEFRGVRFGCSQLVPSGPQYANAPLANKVCAIAGGQPGEDTVDASTYIDLVYGYTWDNAHRNVGIIIGFWIFFLILYMAASEFQTDPASSGGVMIFKRGVMKRSELTRAEKKATNEIPDEQGDTMLATQEREPDLKGKLYVADEVFSFEHVNFDVMIKGEPRRLLNDVSGFVAPGKMTALMGESGAGKTTLLNVLAQRSDVGVVHGDFFVNGRALPRSFQADTGYCQQQDVHLAQTTVREALQFSALLRQPRETPKEERLAYVETVIELLEMQSFAEALVGEVSEGLNVEQRKRLTIGVELAAKPSLLLFLDEPTSGLDAQAAWSIVRFLKKLANEGQAILCTIHQPSGELFNQFDRLLLLQKGGKTVYFGDIGENSIELLSYFKERSDLPFDEQTNPAEYILDVIGAGAAATTDKDWFQVFHESALYSQLEKELAVFRARRSDDGAISKETAQRNNREYAQPPSVQMRVTIRRIFIAYWRDPVYVGSKLFLNVFAGLFIGSSFWGQGQKDSSAALQNKLFAVFMSLVISTSLSQQLQPMFLNYRELFEARERPSKMYSWVAFLISAAIVEVPWNFLGGTLFWAPWYFMVQFGNEGKRAGYSWGSYMLFQLYFCTFAQAVATVAPNAMVASILFSTFFSFVIVFCGVVQPPNQLPYFWRSWMFRLSPFTWIVEGQLGNAIHDKPVRCDHDEMNTVIPPAGQTCDQYLQPFSLPLSAPENPNVTGYYVSNPDNTCGFCSMRQGEDYLRSIEMNSAHRFNDLGYLCAYIVFNLALYFLFFYLFRVHRWSWIKSKGKKKTPVNDIAKLGEEELENAQGPQPHA
ncbi:hypothetical protein MVES1_003737 [Malassezia vespertilionis]|uniref:ABC transporter domain-containing protein n=1 Tax=Malassezia vespertilionis TaxID=2020962 RepID=A0A2N1J8A6_9BASI|nr:uncharacterized protein MVES1_003737 [Malassezia vespertilionis]PKI82790.1 hypothetical protein MVES_003295 [Malassezia vespertilionis]WFD08365.1 hypothetical protein MVES1_003737 [Malassezia vespertilionis]